MNLRNEFDCSGEVKSGHTHSNLNFVKTTDLYRKTLLILQVRAHEIISHFNPSPNKIRVYSKFQGIDLAEKFSTAVNAITNLHVHMKHPITKQSILHVCKLTELLKLIKLTMEKYATEINHTTLSLSQHQIYQALLIISNVKVNELSSNSIALILQFS